jgi:hypothetical protein
MRKKTSLKLGKLCPSKNLAVKNEGKNKYVGAWA